MSVFFLRVTAWFLLGLSLVTICSEGLAQTSGVSTTLRATSRIVYVDVVVHDGRGKIVHGLPASAFAVEENKQAQRIGLFEEHTAATASRAATAASASGKQQYTNVAPEAQDTSLNMVLLDLLNTAPQDQQYARQRMISFLKSLPPHRQVALFVLGNQLRMIQGFTTDSEALIQAASGIDPKQLNRLRTPNQQISDNDMQVYIDRDATGAGGRTAGQLLLQAALQEDIQNMKVRLDVTNRAFQELARAVNGYPGRKNLFWMAGQFPSSSYYGLQILSTAVPTVNTPLGSRVDTAGQQRAFAGPNVAAGLSLSLFSDKANQAISDSQIAVYPISLVGVQTDAVGADQMGIGSAGPAAASTTASTFFQERQTGRAVMENIADQTGGEAFYGNNDPKGLLERGFEDGENYYTLAYQPTDRDWNGKYRTIHVQVAGGYRVSYRKGYFAMPEQPMSNALGQFAQAMRIEAPASTMLVLRSDVPKAQADGTTLVRAALDVRGVGFQVDEASHLRTAKLQVLVIAYPEQRGAPPVESNHVLNLQLEPEDYRRVMEAGVPLPLPLKLQPGRYAVRVGVVDLGTGRIGTLTLPYATPGGASAPVGHATP